MFSTGSVRFAEVACEILLLLFGQLLQEFSRLGFADEAQIFALEITVLSIIGLMVVVNVGVVINSCIRSKIAKNHENFVEKKRRESLEIFVIRRLKKQAKAKLEEEAK